MRRFNVTLENKETLELSEHDLSNSGGEGEIFIKNGYAYKIFFDQNKSIELEKIKELSKLDRDNIIRPIQAIYNDRREQIGYQMKAIEPSKCFPLTRFFTTDFRKQHNITNDDVSHIIKEMYKTFEFIHKKGFLIVDGNEMNFLISDDFKTLYFIDVDSYKTPSFNPTAFNPNTLDPKSNGKTFSEDSDWFIFGILFCQVVVGIHPFKGKYTGTSISFNKRDIVKRIEKGVSIFNPKVKLNKAVRSLSLIPEDMKNWLKNIFTSDFRSKPPLLSLNVNISNQITDLFSISDNFMTDVSDRLNTEVDNIKTYLNSYLYIKDGVYYSPNGDKMSSANNKFFLVKGKPAFAKIIDGNLDVYIPELKIKQRIFDNVDKIYIFNNELFIYRFNILSCIDLFVAKDKLITGTSNNWDLYHHTSINNFVLFYQSGRRKAYYYYEGNKNAMIDIDNMVSKDEKIINIKGFGSYIVMKTIKNNEYYCRIFNLNTFNKKTKEIHSFKSFDISINFILKDDLLIGEVENNSLIIGYYGNEQFKSKTITEFNLNKELMLHKNNISFFDKDKIYKLSVK